MAVSAIGIFAAYRDAAAGPTGRYVVAARRVAVGATIRPGDLRVEAMELPAAVRRRAFADPSALVGARVVAPVERGELVQASDVVDGRAARSRQVSFSIEAARALNGDIRPGERVDIVATYGGGGEEAWTSVIAASVVVADVTSTGSSLNTGRGLVLTLSFDRAGDVLAVTHAARAGTITVVRAGDGDAPGVYRPVPPDDEGR